jgi:hypothetical protein
MALIYLASWITYSINIAIALQVLLGAVSITLDTIVRKKDVRPTSPFHFSHYQYVSHTG